MSRATLVPLGVLLVAAALRGLGLGSWSLDGDELYSYWDVVRLVDGQEWPFGARAAPLGYLLMALGVAVGGPSELALRMLPAACGFAAVAVLLAGRRDVVPRTVSWAAGFLAAVSPWLVYHSQTARFYGPLLLFCTLATLCALPGPGRRPRLALVCTGLGVLCHPSALLLLPAQVLSLAGGPSGWRGVRPLLWAGLGGFVAVAFLDDGSLLMVLERAVGNIDPGRYGAQHLVLGLGYNLGPVVGLLALGGLVLVMRHREPGREVLMTAALGPPLILLLVALIGVSVHQRYAMCAVPGALILAGWALAAAVRTRAVAGWGLVLVVLLGFGPDLVGYGGDGNRHDARGVARWLATHAEPEDIFVIDENSTVLLYLQREAGFADTKTFEAPIDEKKLGVFVRHPRTCWVAVKAARLATGTYGTDFTTWLETYFHEVAQVGRDPLPLRRHDNRYLVFTRTERVRPARTPRRGAPSRSAPGAAPPGQDPGARDPADGQGGRR